MHKKAQTLDQVLIKVLQFLDSKTDNPAYAKLSQKAKAAFAKAVEKKIHHPSWVVAPEESACEIKCSFAPPIRRIAGFAELNVAGANYLQFFAATGLALQGLGKSEINTSLSPKKKGLFGFGGKKTANRAWGIDIGQSSVKIGVPETEWRPGGTGKG